MLPAPRWVLRTILVLLAVEVVIQILDIVFNFMAVIDDSAIQEMFNVAHELSLGNWFSSTQTAAIAVVLWLIRIHVRDTGASRWTVRGWTLLSGTFLYLAIDDGIQAHERISTAASDFFALTAEGGATHGGFVDAVGRLVDWFPSYTWQVLFGPVFAALGIFIVVFVWRRLDRASALTVFGGLFLYAVAQAQDFVEGMETPYDRITERLGTDPYTVPHLARMGEEYLEMVGSTLILFAFLAVYARLKSKQAASDAADEVRPGATLES